MSSLNSRRTTKHIILKKKKKISNSSFLRVISVISPLSQLAYFCAQELFISLSEWPVASLSCSQVQSGAGSNFGLWQCAPFAWASAIRYLGPEWQADPRQAWFWWSIMSHRPQSERWDHVWGLTLPSDGGGSRWIESHFVAQMWHKPTRFTAFVVPDM